MPAAMLLDLSSRPPDWLPPVVKQKSTNKNLHLGSSAEVLTEAKSTQLPDAAYKPTRTRLWTQTVERRNRRKLVESEFSRQLSQWNPDRDVNIRGDANATLFLARLPYTITADQIKQEFEKYGPIESIRIVEPRKGYAFVVYKPPYGPDHAASAVQQTAGGMLFHGRRIITDLERGRLQMNWKPRRLGGGLGGRLSVARQKAEIVRAQQISARGVRPPQQEGRKRPNNGPMHGGYQKNPAPYRRGPPGRTQEPHNKQRAPNSRAYAPANRTNYSQDRQRDQQGDGARPGGRTLRQY